MKKRLKKSMIALMILLSFQAVVCAGDNVSISVSCTIPAIPGLNAPVISEENNTNTQPQEEIKLAQETMKRQDTKNQLLVSEEETNLTFVRTLYSR